jgi:hypothetical protein
MIPQFQTPDDAVIDDSKCPKSKCSDDVVMCKDQ